MRKGVSKTRRVVAAVAASMVALLAMGTGANAALPKPFTTFSQVGSGQVLNLKLRLPKTVTDAVNGVLGAVSLPGGTLALPSEIDESISFSRAISTLTDKLDGTSVGQMFEGNLDKTVLEPVAKTLFNRGLPIAKAFFGTKDYDVRDELKALDIPDASTPIVHVGVMEVTAKSVEKPGIANAVQSISSSKLLGVKVDLTSELKEQLKSVLGPVLEITDGIGDQAGLIDTLNNELLGTVEQLVQDTLDLDVNLELPEIADLLDRPLLSIGLIETGSITDAAGIARNAKGWSKIVDLNIFGSNAENALIHVDSLYSEAFAEIDGTASGAAANAVHKIVGLSVLDNEISVTNDQIKILNKTLPLPTDALNKLTELVGSTLGLDVKVLETTSSKSATFATATANTLRISFHPQIAGLGEFLGLDLTTPSAFAEVAGNIVSSGGCPNGLCQKTGVADQAYLLAGLALVGMAVLVRRFVLAK